MLKLYYARPSLFARPIWLALIEKQLEFELIPVDLGGEQFQPDFLALNPFAHVPVLVDDNLRIFESSAILDYLEAKYPQPALLPEDAACLARVRMVQFVSLNELLPAVVKRLIQDPDVTEQAYAQMRANLVLEFFEQQLAGQIFFAGEQLTIAELVAGTLVGLLPALDISLQPYPQVQDWLTRLQKRFSWQQIQLSSQEWQTMQRKMRVMPRLWQRRRRLRMKTLTL
jgi:glutathione S-transferase